MTTYKTSTNPIDKAHMLDFTRNQCFHCLT